MTVLSPYRFAGSHDYVLDGSVHSQQAAEMAPQTFISLLEFVSEIYQVRILFVLHYMLTCHWEVYDLSFLGGCVSCLIYSVFSFFFYQTRLGALDCYSKHKWKSRSKL